MSLSLAAARDRAQRIIDERQSTQAVPLALAFVQEYPGSYVFTFNSQIWVETGAVEHALAGGAGPIVIRKEGGDAVQVPGDVDIEEWLGEKPLTDWIRAAQI